MLHNFSTLKQCIQSPNTSFHLLPVEGQRNDPKHSQTSIVSNGVEWKLQNFSTLKQCIQSPNTSFASFTCWRLAKWSETLTNINCVQWSRMDASQLQYPETVHSVPKHKFFIFYLLKVREMIRNTHKHHFGSYWLELMLHNFGTPK
jgi:hypothetical protein